MSFSVKQAMGVIIALVCMSLIVVTARTLTVNNNDKASNASSRLWDIGENAQKGAEVTPNIYTILYSDGEAHLNTDDRKIDGKTVVADVKCNSVPTSIGLDDDNCSLVKKVVIDDVIAPTSAHGMFSELQNMTSIENISNLKTNNVSDMYRMFYDSYSITSIDCSGFDTSNVIYASDMFRDCSSLTSLNVEFDVSKVEFFDGMFWDCMSLKTLNISSWKTTSAKSFNSTFAGCWALESIDANVLQPSASAYSGAFGYTFTQCYALKEIDMSKITHLRGLYGAFAYCKSLTKLNLGSSTAKEFKTISHMCESCRALTTVIWPKDIESYPLTKNNYDYAFNDTTMSSAGVPSWYPIP